MEDVHGQGVSGQCEVKEGKAGQAVGQDGQGEAGQAGLHHLNACSKLTRRRTHISLNK